MTILIDVGNTRIKLGWIETATGKREAEPLAVEHANTGRIAAWLDEIDAAPVAALGVNVAGPALAEQLDSLFRDRCGIDVRWITAQSQAAGVRNVYDDPAQLGPDRWMSMVGLGPLARTAPLVLANFGTATTIDTLAPEGDESAAHISVAFHGGLIFPGPELMRSSLAAGTARLPLASGPAAAFPTHTHQAISSGIAAAQAGAILRQWREGLQRYGKAPRVYVAGGGWPLVEEEVRRVLARAQADLGLPQEEVQWLAAPVLDGLGRLALNESV